MQRFHIERIALETSRELEHLLGHGDLPIDCDGCQSLLQYAIDRDRPLNMLIGLKAEYVAFEMTLQMS